MDRRYKITLNIPAWHKKRLNEWAAIKGVAPTTLAANILQARIEANYEQVVAMLQSRAKDEGLTIEEFIRSIVDPETEKSTT